MEQSLQDQEIEAYRSDSQIEGVEDNKRQFSELRKAFEKKR